MIFDCKVNVCKNCGIYIINRNLCDLCKKGYTKEEVYTIRRKISMRKNRELLNSLFKLYRKCNEDNEIKY